MTATTAREIRERLLAMVIENRLPEPHAMNVKPAGRVRYDEVEFDVPDAVHVHLDTVADLAVWAHEFGAELYVELSGALSEGGQRRRFCAKRVELDGWLIALHCFELQWLDRKVSV